MHPFQHLIGGSLGGEGVIEASVLKAYKKKVREVKGGLGLADTHRRLNEDESWAVQALGYLFGKLLQIVRLKGKEAKACREKTSRPFGKLLHGMMGFRSERFSREITF